jgi:ketosteroid isomerase-like protein
MSCEETLAIVRDYHDAWTRKDFDRATARLSSRLEVEVPINDYPTTESFAAAVASFGSLVREVDLLSAMSAGDEAILLYDLDAQGLGTMRVAEHFTVRDGKIARIRQIHDTAPVRAAGLG